MLLRRNAGEQAAVQRAELFVAVVLPEQRVVHRFLEVHVLEVLGDEEREVPVQPQRDAGGVGAARAAQRRGLVLQRRDALDVLDVLAGNALAAGRLLRLDRGVHELVLVLQVGQAEREQLVELVERGLAVGRVVDVDAADAHERVAHEAAQRLVDRDVEIVARRRGARGGAAAAGWVVEGATGSARVVVIEGSGGVGGEVPRCRQCSGAPSPGHRPKEPSRRRARAMARRIRPCARRFGGAAPDRRVRC